MSYRTHTRSTLVCSTELRLLISTPPSVCHMCQQKYFARAQNIFADTCVHGCVYTCVCVHTPKQGLACQTPKTVKLAKYTKTRFAAANRVFVYLAILPFWPKPRFGAPGRAPGRAPAPQKIILDDGGAHTRACAPPSPTKKKNFFFLARSVCTRARVCTRRKKKIFFFFEKIRKNVKKTGLLPP